MLVFRHADQSAEFDRCDWRLRELVYYSERWLSFEKGCDILVTSVERTADQTRRLYLDSGRTPPRASVHDVRPCRGLDAVPHEIEDLEAPGQALADHLSGRWVYPRGHKVCLWHSVAGGLHWHFQVPWDGLSLVA